MDKYTWRQIEKMLKEGSYKRTKRRIMSALAMVVSFVTVGMLVLPAVAMVGDPVYYCGKEEHVHTIECLGAIPVHKHTADCYDENGMLVCDVSGTAGHEEYERIDVYHRLSCGYSGGEVDLSGIPVIQTATESNGEAVTDGPVIKDGYLIMPGENGSSVTDGALAPSAPAVTVVPDEKKDTVEETGEAEVKEQETRQAGETAEDAEEQETEQAGETVEDTKGQETEDAENPAEPEAKTGEEEAGSGKKTELKKEILSKEELEARKERETESKAETEEELEAGEKTGSKQEPESEEELKPEKEAESEKETKAEKETESEKETKAEKEVKTEKETTAEKEVKAEKETKAEKEEKSEKSLSIEKHEVVPVSLWGKKGLIVNKPDVTLSDEDVISEEDEADAESEEIEETKKAKETEAVEETEKAKEAEESEETETVEETKKAKETETAEETEKAKETEAAEEIEKAKETEEAKETEAVEETKKAGETEAAEETEKAKETEEAEETTGAEESKAAEETQEAGETVPPVSENVPSIETDRQLMPEMGVTDSGEWKDGSQPADGTVETGSQNPAADESNENPEDYEPFQLEGGNWILICGLEENENHHHNKDCYLPFDPADYEPNELYDEIIWNQDEFFDDAIYDEEAFFHQDIYLDEEESNQVHVHTPECFSTYEIVLKCGMEEHIHTEECRRPGLTAEQLEQINQVIDMIDALPDIVDVDTIVDELENAASGTEIIVDDEASIEDEIVIEDEDEVLQEDTADDGENAYAFRTMNANILVDDSKNVNRISEKQNGKGLLNFLGKVMSVPEEEAEGPNVSELDEKVKDAIIVAHIEELSGYEEELKNEKDNIQKAMESYRSLGKLMNQVPIEEEVKVRLMSAGIPKIVEEPGDLNSRVSEWYMGTSEEDLKKVEPGSHYEVKDGTELALQVRFSEGIYEGSDFTSVMTYKFPEGLVCEDTDGIVYYVKDGNRERIGTYSIKDNVVTVNFDESFLANYSEASVDLYFDVKIETDGKDKAIEIPVVGGSITVDVHGGAELIVDKVSKGYIPENAQGGKIGYEIKVGTKYGDLTGFEFSDKFNDGDTFYVDYDENSFVLRDPNGEIIPEDWYEITFKDVVNAGDRSFTLKFKEGHEITLKEGEELTLEYYVNVIGGKDVQFDEHGNALPAEEGKTDKEIDNTITAKSNTGKEATDSATEKLLKNDVTKNGKVERIEVTDANGNKEERDVIHWDITVGDGTRDVTGAKIEDVLSDNQTFYRGKPLDIDIYFEGNQIDDDYPGEKIQWTEVEVTTENGKEKLTYTFPTYDELAAYYLDKGYTEEQIRRFKFNIEYYTLPDDKGINQVFSNTADVNINGQDMTVTKDVSGIGKIVKSYELGRNDDGEEVLRYTLKIETEHDYAERFHIRDELRFKTSDGKTYYPRNIPDIVSLEVIDKKTGEEIPYEAYRENLPEGTYYYNVIYPSPEDKDISEFWIVFNTDRTDDNAHHDSSWPHVNPTEITIVYEILLKTPVAEKDSQDDFSENKTIESLIKDGYVLNNTAKFYPGITNYIKASVDYSNPEPEHSPYITKEGAIAKEGEDLLNYTVKFKTWTGSSRDHENRLIKGRLEKNSDYDAEYGRLEDKMPTVESVDFVDTFDGDRLEYVPGSLKVHLYKGSTPEPEDHFATYTVGNDESVASEPGKIRANFTDFNTIVEYEKQEDKDLYPEYGWLRSEGKVKDYYTTLTKTIDHRNYENDSPFLLVFTYQLYIKNLEDELNTGEAYLKYSNEATFNMTGDTKGEFSDDCDVLYPTHTMTKDANQIDGTDIFEFTIEMNKKRQNLIKPLEEEGSDPRTYTLEDMMSSNLTIDLGSFEVYVVQENNTERLLGKDEYEVVPGINVHSFSITGLPDNEYLKIIYRAQVDQKGQVVISNQAQVKGVVNSDVSVEKEATVQRVTARGEGQRGKIIIIKRDDKDNSLLLPGAQFRLYRVKDNGDGNTNLAGLGDPVEIVDANGEPVWAHPIPNLPIDEDGNVIDPVEGTEPNYIWTTGENGSIEVDSKYLFEKAGGTYILMEIKAPEGYITPEGKEAVRQFTYGQDVKFEKHYNDWLQITNTAYGAVLPETGGAGTIPTTLAGLIMSLGAAYVWHDRRSGEEEEDSDRESIC